MPINPAIAMGVQPLQLADPLAQYGKIAAIQQAQNQNALAQYQLGAAQREEAAQNALSRAYQTAYNPETGAYDVNKLRGALVSAGIGSKLPDIEKGLSALATQKLTQSKTESELVDAKLKQSRAFLDTIDPTDPNAPQQYLAWHQANHRDPVLGPMLAARGVTADQSMARIQDAIQRGPQAFAQLVNQSKLGTERFMELNKPTLTTQDVGGQLRVISTPGLGGAATVVPGSVATKTLTPGEAKPTISNVDVGNEILVQSYDPVTRQVTVLERRPKGLTPGEAKPTIQQVDLGGAVVTQEYDPRTRTTRVLETRPKSLSPEQARAASQEKSKVAHTTTDEAGNVTLYNMFGEIIGAKDASGKPVAIKGKPSATFEKTQAQRAQLSKDLDTAIFELKDAVKEGGLIDQSTGSGIGRAVDVGARVFGKATEGDIAIGKLKPIADIVLKMVPRFEGPQSDKDTQSYKEAAGQLADPTMPRAIRKAAAQTIIRLMENRKGQFVTQGMAAEGVGPGGGVDTSNPLLK
jgi:hypothetical protein